MSLATINNENKNLNFSTNINPFIHKETVYSKARKSLPGRSSRAGAGGAWGGGPGAGGSKGLSRQWGKGWYNEIRNPMQNDNQIIKSLNEDSFNLGYRSTKRKRNRIFDQDFLGREARGKPSVFLPKVIPEDESNEGGEFGGGGGGGPSGFDLDFTLDDEIKEALKKFGFENLEELDNLKAKYSGKEPEKIEEIAKKKIGEIEKQEHGKVSGIILWTIKKAIEFARWLFDNIIKLANIGLTMVIKTLGLDPGIGSIIAALLQMLKDTGPGFIKTVHLTFEKTMWEHGEGFWHYLAKLFGQFLLNCILLLINNGIKNLGILPEGTWITIGSFLSNEDWNNIFSSGVSTSTLPNTKMTVIVDWLGTKVDGVIGKVDEAEKNVVKFITGKSGNAGDVINSGQEGIKKIFEIATKTAGVIDNSSKAIGSNSNFSNKVGELQNKYSNIENKVKNSINDVKELNFLNKRIV